MSRPVHLVVARQSGTLMQGRQRVQIRSGVTIAHPDHPLVRSHPRAWQPLRVHYDVPLSTGVVEQATAGPGDLRQVPEPPAAPERPPLSGAGSGVGAWRTYAAAVTDTPLEQWADKNRDEILAELKADQ